MLEESGYRVRTAVGADEALEELKSRRSSSCSPTSPCRAPWTARISRARSIRRHPACPSSSLPAIRWSWPERAEFPLLQKPINSRQLHAAIQRYLTPATRRTASSRCFRAGSYGRPVIHRRRRPAADERHGLLIRLRQGAALPTFWRALPSETWPAIPAPPGKGLEEPLLRRLPEQQLRVPLHAEQEARGLALDRLDDAALVLRDDAQAAPEPVHDWWCRAFTRQGLQRRMRSSRLPRTMRHGLLRQHGAHLRGLHVDLVDVRVQRAAERHVDHLRAAADARAPAGRPAARLSRSLSSSSSRSGSMRTSGSTSPP